MNLSKSIIDTLHLKDTKVTYVTYVGSGADIFEIFSRVSEDHLNQIKQILSDITGENINYVLPNSGRTKLYNIKSDGYKSTIQLKITKFTRTFIDKHYEIIGNKIIITGYEEYSHAYVNNFLTNIRGSVGQTYFNLLPSEILIDIIPKLSILDLLNFKLSIEIPDHIFQYIINIKSSSNEMKNILSEFKLELNTDYYHIYMIFYELFNNNLNNATSNKLALNTKELHITKILYKYYLKLNYPLIYDIINRYCDIEIPNDVQFFRHMEGCEIYKVWYFALHEKHPEEFLMILEDLSSSNPRIDIDTLYILEAAEAAEKYGLDFTKINSGYYRESVYQYFAEKTIDQNLIKFMYNKLGDNASIIFISDVKLFKWFRGYDQDSVIKNTFGPIEYYDLDDLYEMWTDSYIEADSSIKKEMDKTIDFISIDYPAFSKELFYNEIKEMEKYK